jgi:hypothetical protein
MAFFSPTKVDLHTKTCLSTFVSLNKFVTPNLGWRNYLSQGHPCYYCPSQDVLKRERQTIRVSCLLPAPPPIYLTYIPHGSCGLEGYVFCCVAWFFSSFVPYPGTHGGDDFLKMKYSLSRRAPIPVMHLASSEGVWRFGSGGSSCIWHVFLLI